MKKMSTHDVKGHPEYVLLPSKYASLFNFCSTYIETKVIAKTLCVQLSCQLLDPRYIEFIAIAKLVCASYEFLAAAFVCLPAGQMGTIHYSVIFAVVGTTVDYAMLKIKPEVNKFRESVRENSEKNGGWLKLPVWSPIQVLDEEALAAKKAREEKLRAQTNLQIKEEA